MVLRISIERIFQFRLSRLRVQDQEELLFQGILCCLFYTWIHNSSDVHKKVYALIIRMGLLICRNGHFFDDQKQFYVKNCNIFLLFNFFFFKFCPHVISLSSSSPRSGQMSTSHPNRTFSPNSRHS